MPWGNAFAFESMAQARKAFEQALSNIQKGHVNIAVALVTIKEVPQVIIATTVRPTEVFNNEIELLGKIGKSVELSSTNLQAVLDQHQKVGRSKGRGAYRQ